MFSSVSSDPEEGAAASVADGAGEVSGSDGEHSLEGTVVSDEREGLSPFSKDDSAEANAKAEEEEEELPVIFNHDPYAEPVGDNTLDQFETDVYDFGVKEEDKNIEVREKFRGSEFREVMDATRHEVPQFALDDVEDHHRMDMSIGRTYTKKELKEMYYQLYRFTDRELDRMHLGEALMHNPLRKRAKEESLMNVFPADSEAQSWDPLYIAIQNYEWKNTDLFQYPEYTKARMPPQLLKSLEEEGPQAIDEFFDEGEDAKHITVSKDDTWWNEPIVTDKYRKDEHPDLLMPDDVAKTKYPNQAPDITDVPKRVSEEDFMSVERSARAVIGGEWKTASESEEGSALEPSATEEEGAAPQASPEENVEAFAPDLTDMPFADAVGAPEGEHAQYDLSRPKEYDCEPTWPPLRLRDYMEKDQEQKPEAEENEPTVPLDEAHKYVWTRDELNQPIRIDPLEAVNPLKKVVGPMYDDFAKIKFEESMIPENYVGDPIPIRHWEPEEEVYGTDYEAQSDPTTDPEWNESTTTDDAEFNAFGEPNDGMERDISRMMDDPIKKRSTTLSVRRKYAARTRELIEEAQHKQEMELFHMNSEEREEVLKSIPEESDLTEALDPANEHDSEVGSDVHALSPIAELRRDGMAAPGPVLDSESDHDWGRMHKGFDGNVVGSEEEANNDQKRAAGWQEYRERRYETVHDTMRGLNSSDTTSDVEWTPPDMNASHNAALGSEAEQNDKSQFNLSEDAVDTADPDNLWDKDGKFIGNDAMFDDADEQTLQKEQEAAAQETAADQSDSSETLSPIQELLQDPRLDEEARQELLRQQEEEDQLAEFKDESDSEQTMSRDAILLANRMYLRGLQFHDSRLLQKLMGEDFGVVDSTMDGQDMEYLNTNNLMFPEYAYTLLHRKLNLSLGVPLFLPDYDVYFTPELTQGVADLEFNIADDNENKDRLDGYRSTKPRYEKDYVEVMKRIRPWQVFGYSVPLSADHLETPASVEEAMFQLNVAQPLIWTARALSAKFGYSLPRTQAILRLQYHEKHLERSGRKDGYSHFYPTEWPRSDMMLYEVEHQKIMAQERHKRFAIANDLFLSALRADEERYWADRRISKVKPRSDKHNEPDTQVIEDQLNYHPVKYRTVISDTSTHGEDLIVKVRAVTGEMRNPSVDDLVRAVQRERPHVSQRRNSVVPAPVYFKEPYRHNPGSRHNENLYLRSPWMT